MPWSATSLKNERRKERGSELASLIARHRCHRATRHSGKVVLKNRLIDRCGRTRKDNPDGQPLFFFHLQPCPLPLAPCTTLYNGSGCAVSGLVSGFGKFGVTPPSHFHSSHFQSYLLVCDAGGGDGGTAFTRSYQIVAWNVRLLLLKKWGSLIPPRR